MVILKGNPVSQGFAMGKVYIYKAFSCDVFETYFEPEPKIPVYLDNYLKACESADQELLAVIASFDEKDAEKAKIFEAHREILADEDMNEEIRSLICDERAMPDHAVDKIYSEFAALLRGVDDPLIAARATDLRDVRNRLIRILHGEPERNLSRLQDPVIIVAHDLLPSDTATLDRAHVLGIVTEVGGSTSHTAILARSFGIPAVLGVPGATEALTEGETILLDAQKGNVFISADAESLALFEENRRNFEEDRRVTLSYLSALAALGDGTPIQIGLNIGSPQYDEAYRYASFVGLFRSEFLYMQNTELPDEETQFKAYKQALENAGGKPVTLRTLDIGGDKHIPYLPMEEEDNPFLGCRALRLCLKQPELFRTQLRAALRASAFGELWVMFPMVGSIEDIRAARRHLDAAKEELKAEGRNFDPKLKVGIMIEIPSIAMLSDLAAKECDFASVGTNDLCQYLHAVDRMNSTIGEYYQSYSPAMLRMLERIFAAFNKAGKPISVCGELAGDPLAAPVLAGLGLRKFSMNASAIAKVKQALSQYSLKEAEDLAQEAINCPTQEEVLRLLKHKR